MSLKKINVLCCRLLKRHNLLYKYRTYINMASEHIKLDVTNDKIAIATMVNGENRFRTSYLEEWMKTLDAVER